MLKDFTSNLLIMLCQISKLKISEDFSFVWVNPHEHKTPRKISVYYTLSQAIDWHKTLLIAEFEMLKFVYIICQFLQKNRIEMTLRICICKISKILNNTVFAKRICENLQHFDFALQSLAQHCIVQRLQALSFLSLANASNCKVQKWT